MTTSMWERSDPMTMMRGNIYTQLRLYNIPPPPPHSCLIPPQKCCENLNYSSKSSSSICTSSSAAGTKDATDLIQLLHLEITMYFTMNCN